MEREILEQLQKVELNILIDFDAYCKAHNLRYYLIGGALLGAVRYKNFIPWDDDIDVAMPREDYEKLKSVWNQFPDSNYFLQSAESDPNFSRCIIKLRKQGTEIIEYSSQAVNMNNGIYIDIFPIDYISDYDYKIIDKRAKLIRRLMSIRAIKSGYNNNRYILIKKLIRYFTIFISNNTIDKKINQLCVKENNGSRKYAVLFLHNYDWSKQIHLTDVFGNGSLCEFEGHEFSAPAKKEMFLMKVFGENYMREPPLNRQKSPHSFVSVIIDKYAGGA